MKNDQNVNLYEETTTIEKQNTSTPKPASKQKKAGIWKRILIGGVPGIILGTAGTVFAHEAADTDTQDAENGAETNSSVGTDAIDTADAVDTSETVSTVNIQNIDAQVSETVSDDMNFSDAFDAARAEVGPGGIFEWHGNIYSTFTTDEWNSMSDEDRQVFADNAVKQLHADDSVFEEPQNEDLQDVPENENIVTEGGEADVIDGKSEIPEIQEIEIPGAQSLTAEHIEIVNVAVDTDHHDAELVDGVVVASNDNSPIQENEAVAVPESDVTVSELAMMSDHTEDSLFQDIPDYTNDADTSSLA